MWQKGSLTQQGAGARQAKPSPSPPEDPSRREMFPKVTLPHTGLGRLLLALPGTLGTGPKCSSNSPVTLPT